jgi:endonuclease G, mitochondrial
LDPAAPVVALSRTREYDFALLRAHADVSRLTNVVPAPFSVSVPAQKMALNILQHPKGGPMMLSASSSGVTGAYPDRGILQYVSRTDDGSSGSPCFDDEWRVVALHHAARSRTFGVIGEGILFSAIYDLIKPHMAAPPT